MPPKTKQARTTSTPNAKAKGAPSKGAGNKQNASKGTQKESQGWEWQWYTVKSVTFNKAAKTLAAEVESLYGNQGKVSISHFEKMVAAMGSMSKDERAMIHVSKSALEALSNYIKARDERDSERQAFRSDVKIVDVEGTLGALLASIGSDGTVDADAFDNASKRDAGSMQEDTGYGG